MTMAIKCPRIIIAAGLARYARYVAKGVGLRADAYTFMYVYSETLEPLMGASSETIVIADFQTRELKKQCACRDILLLRAVEFVKHCDSEGITLLW